MGRHMDCRTWPYRIRTAWNARPFWLQALIVILGLVILAAWCSALSGCAYISQGYAMGKALDDEAAQSLKIAICSLPNPTYSRNYRPEEIEALQALCGWNFAVDCKTALERARASCEEVGP